MTSTENQQIAEKLRELSDLLEIQGADRFRVAAYRRAAQTVSTLQRDLSNILKEEGIKGLIALPNIGRSIARAIDEMVRTGRWGQLERLRGEAEPEKLFQAVPGVGPELAKRIHNHLHIDTLEALEIAAHDGRLEKVPGIGLRRAAILKGALANMLAHPRAHVRESGNEPQVKILLDVDREYRTKAVDNKLRTIAPKRFNPSMDSWLPILHTERNEWSFTVLFSNTAHAHELYKTRDWVVIYFHTDNNPEGQRTVVTENRGSLAGKRVVRGREQECRDYYETA